MHDEPFDSVTGKLTIAVTPEGLFPDDLPQEFCYLREARKFLETCPTGCTCTAGGECNALGAKPALDIVTAIVKPKN